MQHVAVRVFDEDESHGTRWARLYGAEQNLRDREASVEQAAFYYRETGITDAEAEERGLLPRDMNGRPMKTLTMGATIARRASDEVYRKFLAGEMTAEEAYAEAAKNEGGTSFAVDAELRDNVGKACNNALSNKKVVSLCRVPNVLRAIEARFNKKLPDWGNTSDVVTKGTVLKKLHFEHSLSEEQIIELVVKMDDPELVLQDSEQSYIFMLDMKATNKKGEQSPVMAALGYNNKEGRYVLSAYPLEHTQKIAAQIGQKHVVYSKYSIEEWEQKAAAYLNDGAPDSFKSDLVRSLVGSGFHENAITSDEKVNPESESGSSSFALDLDNGVGAMQLAAGRSAEEEVFRKLLHSIAQAGKQWQMRFKGSYDEREKARGSTMALAMGIYRKLPAGYRVKLELMLRRAAVLERMIATGKLRSYGQISSAELAELRADVERGRIEAFAEEGLGAYGLHTTKKEAAEHFREETKAAIEQVGRDGLEGVYRAMAEEAAAVVRRYLHDTEMQKLAAMVERFMPKVGANKKLAKGKYGAAFVNEVNHLRDEVMSASAQKRADKTRELSAHAGKGLLPLSAVSILRQGNAYPTANRQAQ